MTRRWFDSTLITQEGLRSDWAQAPIHRGNEGRGDTLRSLGYAQDKLGSGQAPQAPQAFAAQRHKQTAFHLMVEL